MKRLGIDYQHLFRTIPDNYAVLAVDDGYTVVDASDAYVKLLRTTHEKIINRSVFQVYDNAHDRTTKSGEKTLITSLKAVLETGKSDYMGITRVDIGKDGGQIEAHYFEATNYPIYDHAHEKIVGIIHATHDITAEVTQNEHLEVIKLQYDASLLYGAIGSWRIDFNTSKVLVDDVLHHMLGIDSHQRYVSLDFSEILSKVHPDDLPRVEAMFSESGESSNVHEIEFRLYDKNGEQRWVNGRGKTTLSGNNLPESYIGVVIDITERKRNEQNLEKIVQERTKLLRENAVELERSNKELEDFAYVASHDLQEPLRKIQAFGNLLEDEYGDKLGDGEDYLKRMKAAAGRMSVLIEDLLAFSRVTTKAKEAEPVSLSQVTADVVSDLEARIKETGGKVEIASELPVVMADPTHMRQLMQNLIGNALKFHREDVAPVVTLESARKGNLEMITVTDNGIGFESKYIERIFTVFQRLHGREKYEGTGIGLAVCRKIVERYGGSITATSTVGEGSKFIITLPAEKRQSHNVRTNKA